MALQALQESDRSELSLADLSACGSVISRLRFNNFMLWALWLQTVNVPVSEVDILILAKCNLDCWMFLMVFNLAS